MIPKHERLIDDLLRKTESGDLTWELTDAENQFALNLKRGAILLDMTSTLFGKTFVITLLNNEGQQIDRINLFSEPDRSMAQNLYEIIHRRMNRIDEQIDEIIGELETL